MFNTIASAFSNMNGYFSGLSSPSVTLDKNDARRLAEVEAARADQVPDVLDHDRIEIAEVDALDRRDDHPGLEVAGAVGDDLNRPCAGPRDPLRVPGGLEIPLDDEAPHRRGAGSVVSSSVVLPDPGAERTLTTKSPAAANRSRRPRAISSFLRDDVALQIDDPDTPVASTHHLHRLPNDPRDLDLPALNEPERRCAACAALSRALIEAETIHRRLSHSARAGTISTTSSAPRAGARARATSQANDKRLGLDAAELPDPNRDASRPDQQRPVAAATRNFLLDDFEDRAGYPQLVHAAPGRVLQAIRPIHPSPPPPKLPVGGGTRDTMKALPDHAGHVREPVPISVIQNPRLTSFTLPFILRYVIGEDDQQVGRI